EPNDSADTGAHQDRGVGCRTALEPRDCRVRNTGCPGYSSLRESGGNPGTAYLFAQFDHKPRAVASSSIDRSLSSWHPMTVETRPYPSLIRGAAAGCASSVRLRHATDLSIASALSPRLISRGSVHLVHRTVGDAPPQGRIREPQGPTGHESTLRAQRR